MTIRLPKAMSAFEVRLRKALGQVDTIQAELTPKDLRPFWGRPGHEPPSPTPYALQDGATVLAPRGDLTPRRA
ncbi:MAG: hypothetical protein FJ291_31250 [Planctomycetes bacterium]|nr:hypothetical protein [Planctomycetota bacterium]